MKKPDESLNSDKPDVQEKPALISRRKLLVSGTTALAGATLVGGLFQQPLPGLGLNNRPIPKEFANRPISKMPEVTFFVESKDKKNRLTDDISRGQFLQNAIGGDEVIQGLLDIRGRLSIAVGAEDIKSDRAFVEYLRQLKLKGIPFDAWINLSDNEGYYINKDNIGTATGSFLDVINLLEKAHVEPQKIGCDLEPPLGWENNKWEYLNPIGHKFRYPNGDEIFHKFVEQLLANDNYGVSTYEMPFLTDGEWWRNRFGILSTPQIEKVERVAMTYSTLIYGGLIPPKKYIHAYSYGMERIPAIGIVQAEGSRNPGRDQSTKYLQGVELDSDVRSALEVSPDKLYVFALNGPSVLDNVRSSIEKTMKS